MFALFWPIFSVFLQYLQLLLCQNFTESGSFALYESEVQVEVHIVLKEEWLHVPLQYVSFGHCYIEGIQGAMYWYFCTLSTDHVVLLVCCGCKYAVKARYKFKTNSELRVTETQDYISNWSWCHQTVFTHFKRHLNVIWGTERELQQSSCCSSVCVVGPSLTIFLWTNICVNVCVYVCVYGQRVAHLRAENWYMITSDWIRDLDVKILVKTTLDVCSNYWNSLSVITFKISQESKCNICEEKSLCKDFNKSCGLQVLFGLFHWYLVLNDFATRGPQCLLFRGHRWPPHDLVHGHMKNLYIYLSIYLSIQKT